MAETVNRALVSGWISRYGCPQTITNGQGWQFESQLFHSLASRFSIQQSHTTHKAAIMCQAQERWTKDLPLSSSAW
jgi:hypothetical protein